MSPLVWAVVAALPVSPVDLETVSARLWAGDAVTLARAQAQRQARGEPVDTGTWGLLDDLSRLGRCLPLGRVPSAEAPERGQYVIAEKRRVADGLTFEEVDDSIQSVALAENIRDVGQLPLGEQVALMQGSDWRQLKIYLYCNPLTAAKMVEYSEAFAAYLPCRIALVEDDDGALWLYSLDMDMMIHGGKPLPPDLKAEAERVKKVILTILDKAATGDF